MNKLIYEGIEYELAEVSHPHFRMEGKGCPVHMDYAEKHFPQDEWTPMDGRKTFRSLRINDKFYGYKQINNV